MTREMGREEETEKKAKGERHGGKEENLRRGTDALLARGCHCSHHNSRNHAILEEDRQEA
jgi:hypothetical protein